MIIERWTGHETRALRNALRMTVGAFAGHLGVAVRTVAKWEERGSTIFLSPEMQAILDTALRQASDEECFRFELLLNRTDDQYSEDIAKRRDATKLLGTALSILAQPPFMEVLAQSEIAGEGGHVDEQLVAGHGEVSSTLAGLYRAADPRAALPVVSAYGEALLELLGHSMGDRVRAKLMPLVVGVYAQIGLWACHMGRFAVGYQYLSTACDIAETSGDRSLQARALGAFSYLFSSAPRGGHAGDPTRALTLLGRALDLAGGSDGFTRGWLATWRADQRATLGDVAGAIADVELADRSLSVGDGDSVRGFFARSTYGYGMEDHLDSVRALVLALEGDSDRDRAFDQVMSQAKNTRRQVATLGHQALGWATVNGGDAQAACQTLSKAISLGEQSGYTMGLRRAAGVRTGFDSRWSSLPCVTDVDEQLHQAGV